MFNSLDEAFQNSDCIFDLALPPANLLEVVILVDARGLDTNIIGFLSLKGSIPFGQYLYKSNMVAINRDGGTKAMRKMLQEVETKLSTGSSIIIFPEGTRKIPGAKPDYKPGVAGIYKELDYDVLPVALNSGLYWPKNSFAIKPGEIIIEFLPFKEFKIFKPIPSCLFSILF